MKIVHVIQGLPRTAGTTVFPVELAAEQVKLGHEVEIVHFTFNECGYSKVPIRKIATLDDLGYIPEVVHVHALWSMCQVKALQWCSRNKVKYIVSIHGCLMPRVMKKGWLKKHIFYWLFLKKNLQSAAAIHCTGDGERDAVEALGLKPPKIIAPLGCHLPLLKPDSSNVHLHLQPTPKTLLFLGRLGEEKGLMFLLDAWKAIDHKNWKLTIAGPSWLGYSELLKAKVKDEGITDVDFPGNANEKVKDELYRAADLFILPSPTENFSMVVLDALAYGVPVICTKGTPWKCIEENKCGWWIEPNSVEAIRVALEEAMSLPQEEVKDMGKRARDLATKFSWSEVAKTIEKELVRVL